MRKGGPFRMILFRLHMFRPPPAACVSRSHLPRRGESGRPTCERETQAAARNAERRIVGNRPGSCKANEKTPPIAAPRDLKSAGPEQRRSQLHIRVQTCRCQHILRIFLLEWVGTADFSEF